MQDRTIVIGAGIGGLATAIRLQHAGRHVTVLEKNSRVGGRCNVLQEQGFTFDMGPTLLLMRDVLDDLFETVGHRVSDYMELVRVHPNYRVHFGNGSSVEFSGDEARMAEELEALEPGSSAAFARYMADAEYKYRVARARFVERNFNHWYEFATLTNLFYLLRTNTLRKLSKHARSYFADRRLAAAVTFQTMYLGLAPRQAPSVYSLLPFTEIREGIWFPRGGMYTIAESLCRLAVNLGVEVMTDTEVSQIVVEGDNAVGVRLANGELLAASTIISNADLPYTYESLIPPANTSRQQRMRLDHVDYGSSAFLMYLGVDRQYPHMNHHDVYLSSDVDENFDAIFKHLRLPEDPSFYTCLPAHTDPSMAPAGCEALYVLVPVPHLNPNVDWKSEAHAFKERMYDRLEDAGFEDLRDHVVFEQIFTPDDFVSEYNAMKGSAFGLSHNFFQVGYMRPSNKASGLKNMYFVGASTVPGGGVPMVILGSRLTAKRVQQDRKGA